jgi:hypothetical protein
VSAAVAAPRRQVRLPRPRLRSVPGPLAVLLAVAALQGLAWAAFTAPLNGPDEQGHAAYAQHLAETGDGPQRGGRGGSLSTEYDRLVSELNLGAILGHEGAVPAFGLVDSAQRRLDALPDRARKDGSGPNAVAQNPPLYYAYAALAYRLSPDRSTLGRLFAMRLATVALFVLTVLFTWLIAAEVFAATWPRFVAAGLVALQPKLGFLAGVINADSLLITLSTGFLLAAVRLVRRGPSAGRVAALAAFAAAGAATHGRGFALLPAALFVLALVAVRARPPRRELVRLAAIAGGTLLAGVALAYLWTRGHNEGTGGAFGGELSQGTREAFNVRQFLSYVFQFYFGPFSFLTPLGPPHGYRQVYIDTYFSSFAALEVEYRTAIRDLLQIGAGTGLLLFAMTVAARLRAVTARLALWATAAVTFLSLLALLHVSAYRDLQAGGDPLITGRYLLPCVALYGLAIGWVAWSLPRRVGVTLAAAVLAAFVLLSVGAIGLEAERFYA